MVNDKCFMILENVMKGKITSAEGINKFNSLIKDNEVNASKVNCIKRTLFSYSLASSSNKGWSDFFVNLRMVILSYNRRIEIGGVLREKYKKYHLKSDLNLELNAGRYFLNVVTLNIRWIENLEELKRVYSFEKKAPSRTRTAIGDYRLKNMTGFDSYSSYSQKLIIRAIENQIGGTTILATMPTGGGKSLPNQFISFYEEFGTTIVVVPTIALAIDQSKSAEKYFKGERVVRAYYEGISQSEKYYIINELKSGKIALLYLSPESILNGSFHDGILESAQNNIVKRLVIDEAHIIAEWGEFFRTEFQFLALFRRKLLEVTNNELKTVLLSATVTDNTEEVLKKLYSEVNNFIQIRGDSLRNEIVYYISRCQNESERKQRILEILPMMPRPLIIYVPVIQKAEEYYSLLENQGHRRMRMFTSRTSSSERSEILNAWENDQLDIIIATSAFGMGVNKKEIRAVIHTFVPESIDRFYQEVGRGGRDGYTALSFVFTSLKDDEDHIKFFTRSRVLKAESIVTRWTSILEENQERISGDMIWVSSDIVPENLKDELATGSLNVAWNEYVLLFLYRQGIIDLIDMKINPDTGNRSVLIKLLKIDLINNKDKLLAYLKPIRDREREIVDKEIHYVKEMIKNTKLCWSTFFKIVYGYTEKKCNGCPTCIGKNKRKTVIEDSLEVIENKELLYKSFLNNRESLSEILYWKNTNEIEINNKIINKLWEYKIDCLILQDDFKVAETNDLKEKKMYIYTYSDFLDENESNMISGNVGIVYGDNHNLNNQIFNKIEKLKRKDRVKTLVAIIKEDIQIDKEGKGLTQIMDGTITYLGGSNV